MSEVKAPATLGPNQIAWCRKNIRAFDPAWRDVQKAEAHAAKVYDKMGVSPGQVTAGAAAEKEGQQ